ncbi:MAG: iron ABC transporter permease [Ancalomicrobiaceae bacterium]|nr:iron ABC transporter permease [Ancalomicrobiaceae bacterium]
MTLAFPRRWPELVLTLCVAVALGLFILVPIASVLGESFVVSAPMTPARLAAVTSGALDRLPDAERAATIQRWAASATAHERVDAMAAAYALAGVRVDWDRKAAYSDQAEALQASLRRLGTGERQSIERHYPLAVVMLFKRVPLAFKVRADIGEDGFDRLRNGTESHLGLDQYIAIFTDPYLRAASINSLELGTISSLLTVAIALLIAYGVHTRAIVFPGATRVLMLLPLVSPPVLTAVSILMLFGRNGLVTHALLDRTFHLIDADTTNIYGLGGVVMAQVLSHVPAALIVLDDVMKRRDGRLEDAAFGLGVGPFGVIRHVTLPLAWPGIKRAIVLTFILSLTDFGNPLLIGRGTPVLAGIIYDQITAFQNHALAAALCIWFLVPPLILYLGLESFGRRRRFVTAGTAALSDTIPPVAWRIVLSVLAGLFVAVTAAVYATMLAGAFVHTWGSDWTPTLAYFGFGETRSALAGTGYGSADYSLASVLDSLMIAALAGPIGGLIAVLTAYVAERVRPVGADVIAFSSLIPALLPGIVFGIGYIVAFNLPFGMKSLSLVGTTAILVINIAFSKLYVGVLAARAALQRYDAGIEEAAESLGAGLIDRLTRVTLPMLTSAVLLGTLYVFVEGLTTLSAVIFLVSGNHKLAAVEIFNHANAGEFGFAASKSLILFVIAAVAIALIWRIERSTGLRRSAQRSSRRGREPDLAAVPAE